jgi:hypothetical protein
MFAALAPLQAGATTGLPSTAAQLHHLAWWPLVLALQSAVTCAAIVNCKDEVRRTTDGAPGDLVALLGWYRNGLTKGLVAVGVTGAGLLVAFALMEYGPVGLRPWLWVVAVVALLAEVTGISSQERARHTLAASVGGDRGELAVDPPAGPGG